MVLCATPNRIRTSFARDAATSRGASRAVIAPVVAGLFFPQSQALGIDPDGGYSPVMLARVTRDGTMSESFQAARDTLLHTGELPISTKHVQRLTERTGDEAVSRRAAEAAAFEALPLPARREAPAGVVPPSVAVVSADGGRIQIFDRVGDDSSSSSERVTHWRETKVGSLLSMESETHATDPCPQVPPAFVEPRYVSKLAREVGHVSATADSAENEQAAEKEADAPTKDSDARRKPRPGLPKLLARSLVATLRPVEAFALLLAAAAWKQGFHAASRKAFLGDGSSTLWTVWRMYFSHYVPIVDFIHALSYVFAAALAGRSAAEGWPVYLRWIQWLWSGDVEAILAELAVRQAELGEPQERDEETAPRKVVATCCTYLRNQRDRMRYAEYRRQGLPITTCHIESAVKQIGRRVKSTEKFWSPPGAEAVLALRAAYLSDDQPMAEFWKHRPANATGQREYRAAA
jgi:hypothetical protein